MILIVCYAVLVVVDVYPLWNRSHLDPEIIKLLHVHQNTPSILVLNKVRCLILLCFRSTSLILIFETLFQSLLKLYPLCHFLSHPLKRLISPHFWRAMAFSASNFKCYSLFLYRLILVTSNKLCFLSECLSVAVLFSIGVPAYYCVLCFIIVEF